MRTANEPRRVVGPPEQGVGNGNGGTNGDAGLHNYVQGLGANGDSSSPSSSDESGRLSVIMENGDGDPPSPTKPPRASHRPFPRLIFGSDPPLHDHDRSPPPYSSLADVVGPKGEKLLDLRNRKQVARRGGWKRLVIIGAVLVALIVGLTVGLVVGLRNKHKNTIADDIPPAPAASSAYPSGPFPVGSYSIQTFLTTVSTNCTSNPATWRCYPYSTYAQSPTLSMATFDWIITAANASSPDEDKYSISSTQNPFALSFAAVPLSLQSQGLDYEHYTFSVPMDKTVIPTNSLTSSSGSAALDTCYFNGTTLFASLYTKQKKTLPSASAGSSMPAATGTAAAPPASTPSGAFSPYPFAVEIQQTISGGADAPACFATNNGNPTGPQITDGVSGKPGQCGCIYQNFQP